MRAIALTLVVSVVAVDTVIGLWPSEEPARLHCLKLIAERAANRAVRIEEDGESTKANCKGPKS